MKPRRAPHADPLSSALNRLIDQLAEEVLSQAQGVVRRVISVKRRPPPEPALVSIPGGLPLKEAVERFRKAHVKDAIERCGFNKKLAARHLRLAYAGLKAIVEPGLRPAGFPRKWRDLSPIIEPLTPATRRFEKKYIRGAVKAARGDRGLAAKKLGIGYSTLKAKVRRLRLRLPAARIRRKPSW
jgi:DNA-binding NtrC family response regulator